MKLVTLATLNAILSFRGPQPSMGKKPEASAISPARAQLPKDLAAVRNDNPAARRFGLVEKTPGRSWNKPQVSVADKQFAQSFTRSDSAKAGGSQARASRFKRGASESMAGRSFDKRAVTHSASEQRSDSTQARSRIKIGSTPHKRNKQPSPSNKKSEQSKPSEPRLRSVSKASQRHDLRRAIREDIEWFQEQLPRATTPPSAKHVQPSNLGHNPVRQGLGPAVTSSLAMEIAPLQWQGMGREDKVKAVLIALLMHNEGITQRLATERLAQRVEVMRGIFSCPESEVLERWQQADAQAWQWVEVERSVRRFLDEHSQASYRQLLDHALPQFEQSPTAPTAFAELYLESLGDTLRSLDMWSRAEELHERPIQALSQIFEHFQRPLPAKFLRTFNVADLQEKDGDRRLLDAAALLFGQAQTASGSEREENVRQFPPVLLRQQYIRALGLDLAQEKLKPLLFAERTYQRNETTAEPNGLVVSDGFSLRDALNLSLEGLLDLPQLALVPGMAQLNQAQHRQLLKGSLALIGESAFARMGTAYNSMHAVLLRMGESTAEVESQVGLLEQFLRVEQAWQVNKQAPAHPRLLFALHLMRSSEVAGSAEHVQDLCGSEFTSVQRGANSGLTAFAEAILQDCLRDDPGGSSWQQKVQALFEYANERLLAAHDDLPVDGEQILIWLNARAKEQLRMARRPLSSENIHTERQQVVLGIINRPDQPEINEAEIDRWESAWARWEANMPQPKVIGDIAVPALIAEGIRIGNLVAPVVLGPLDLIDLALPAEFKALAVLVRSGHLVHGRAQDGEPYLVGYVQNEDRVTAIKMNGENGYEVDPRTGKGSFYARPLYRDTCSGQFFSEWSAALPAENVRVIGKPLSQRLAVQETLALMAKATDSSRGNFTALFDKHWTIDASLLERFDSKAFFTNLYKDSPTFRKVFNNAVTNMDDWKIREFKGNNAYANLDEHIIHILSDVSLLLPYPSIKGMRKFTYEQAYLHEMVHALTRLLDPGDFLRRFERGSVVYLCEKMLSEAGYDFPKRLVYSQFAELDADKHNAKIQALELENQYLDPIVNAGVPSTERSHLSGGVVEQRVTVKQVWPFLDELHKQSEKPQSGAKWYDAGIEVIADKTVDTRIWNSAQLSAFYRLSDQLSGTFRQLHGLWQGRQATEQSSPKWQFIVNEQTAAEGMQTNAGVNAAEDQVKVHLNLAGWYLTANGLAPLEIERVLIQSMVRVFTGAADLLGREADQNRGLNGWLVDKVLAEMGIKFPQQIAAKILQSPEGNIALSLQAGQSSARRAAEEEDHYLVEAQILVRAMLKALKSGKR